jgi:hypothetical protein
MRQLAKSPTADSSSAEDRYSITSLAPPRSVAGISMPSALTFENIGMLPVFNPEVCNGWSLADVAERLA